MIYLPYLFVFAAIAVISCLWLRGGLTSAFEHLLNAPKCMAPEAAGALMGGYNPSVFPDFVGFTDSDMMQMANAFALYPSNRCSKYEHGVMYDQNEAFIQRHLPTNLRGRFHFINLVKHGRVRVIRAQTPEDVKEQLSSSNPHLYHNYMFILGNVCDRLNKHEAWKRLLRKCHIPQLEYDAFFGLDRLEDSANLFLESTEMRDQVIQSKNLFHNSKSNIPLLLWYNAVKAALKAPQSTDGNNLLGLNSVSLTCDDYLLARYAAETNRDKEVTGEIERRIDLIYARRTLDIERSRQSLISGTCSADFRHDLGSWISRWFLNK